MDIDFNDVTITRDSHSERGKELCATEALAFLSGEAHDNQLRPRSVCDVIITFVNRINVQLTDLELQFLKPFLVRMVGTKDGNSVSRARILANELGSLYSLAKHHFDRMGNQNLGHSYFYKASEDVGESLINLSLAEGSSTPFEWNTYANASAISGSRAAAFFHQSLLKNATGHDFINKINFIEFPNNPALKIAEKLRVHYFEILEKMVGFDEKARKDKGGK